MLAGCLLAWLGVLLCFLLLNGHAAALFCPARLGCETVLSSGYGALLGIPLPWVGIAFYAGVLGLLLVTLGTSSPATRLRGLNAALWLSVAAASFSAALMFVQFFVLRAFCPLCTASALCVAGLAGIAWRAGTVAETAHQPGAPSFAIALAGFAVLTGATLAAVGVRNGGIPGPQRLVIDLTTAQVAGPQDAPVQLVVFSDFQCQFCAQLAPVLARVRTEFPREVLVAYRYFPLEAHPRALPAAIAAECAAEQDSFWKYHDKLYAEGGDLSDARLLALAAELGLDEGKFRACLSFPRARQVVEASHRDAVHAGLEGAPALFLDGTRIGGVVTYEQLAPLLSERVRAVRARATPPPD